MKDLFHSVKMEDKHGRRVFISKVIDKVHVVGDNWTDLSGKQLTFDWLDFDELQQLFIEHGYYVIESNNIERKSLNPRVKEDLR